MIAASVANDGDLKYSERDISRFRNETSFKSGPIGLFLKYGKDSELYLAKPFVYGTVAAPFYKFMGVNGFYVLNCICLIALVLSLTISLKGLFSNFDAAAISVVVLIFSPALPFVFVAHPDLFIAAMLAGSLGLLMLRKQLPITAGALLFGLLIYEKPTFVIIVPLLLVGTWFATRNRSFVVLLVCSLLLGWLLPSLVAISQDGHLLSYQGQRFYSGAAPFPLEAGWARPAGVGITAHVFDVSRMMSVAGSALRLVPEKTLDLLIGRQAGFLVYFPGVFALFVTSLLARKPWPILLVVGFILNWAINAFLFPTNGYGGSQTYGSRYILQTLPLCWIGLYSVNAFIRPVLSKASVAVATLLGVGLQWSVVTQAPYGAISNPGKFIFHGPGKHFPIERTLLATSTHVLPGSFQSANSHGKLIFLSGDPDSCFAMTGLQSDLVLLSSRRTKEVFVEVAVTRPGMVASGSSQWTVESDFVWHKIKLTSFEVERIDDLMTGALYIHSLSLRYSTMDTSGIIRPAMFVRLPPEDATNSVRCGGDVWSAGSPGLPMIPPFAPGTEIPFSESSVVNRLLVGSWGSAESWGRWMTGQGSGIDLPLHMLSSEPVILELEGTPYIGKEHGELDIAVEVNGVRISDLSFRHPEPWAKRYVSIPRELVSDNVLRIRFRPLNATSPLGIGRSNDPRMLSFGFSKIRIVQ